jgi:hypothetical protein
MENRGMSQTLRIVLAAVAAVIALLLVPVALAQLSLTYYLPGPTGRGTSRTVLYGPGVAATVVAGVVFVAELGWLLWNLLRTPPRPLWLAAAGVLIGSIVVVLGVAGADRPAF